MASRKDIGQALEALYAFMVRIGYVEHTDINWSPHDPPLPLEICEKVGLSESAISLIETIPWPRQSTFTGEIAAYTFLVDWALRDMVEGSRHPDHFWLNPAEEAGPYITPPNQVAVTWFAEGNRGVLWLIDADKGTLRAIEANAGEWESSEEYNAANFIRERVERFEKLELIPILDTIIYPSSDDTSNRHAKIVQALHEYGWPENFQRADWRRDIADLKKKWDDSWMEEASKRLLARQSN